MASSSRTTFQIHEATLEDIQYAFRSNELTSQELVRYYLDRIEEFKDKLSAVIEVNPNAMALAEDADNERNCSSGEHSILHGVPVLLKDNIAVKDDYQTTAGSYALLNSIVAQDAGVVEKLKNCGAIILGKAGLTEWSSARTDVPEGWSARGGTVKNPYYNKDSDYGSSTGSAVSVAANLVMVSLGTETIGSILCPCSENCVVGIKPTLGVTSRSGVIPYSCRQDSVGSIGRTVSDAVHLLDGITGFDPRDETTTAAAQMHIPKNGYKQHLIPDGLLGKKIGNMWNIFESNYQSQSPIPSIFQEHINTMRDCGAEIIAIDAPTFDMEMHAMYKLMTLALNYELKRDLNKYFSDLEESQIRSLSDVITFNEDNPELEMLDDYGQQSFIDANKTNVPSGEYDNAIANLEATKLYFENLMKNNQLDALVAPEGCLCGLLAVGGYPGIIVPAGFFDNVPFGIMFGGMPGYDGRLIEIAYALEKVTKVRKAPLIKKRKKKGQFLL